MAKKTKRAKPKRAPAWAQRAKRSDDSEATRYAYDVVRKAIVAGPLVRLACERHLRDLLDGHKRGLRFDRDKAARITNFFETFLKLSDGVWAGKPFLLEPWQCFILQSLFGWVTADGYRRFRLAFCELGKGNGKSPMCAGVGLYGLVADNEASAEIYSAATARDQATILVTDAGKMVAASPELSSVIRSNQNNLSGPDYSFFRPVSSEHRALDGKRVHMALIDEIMEHPNDLVVEKMIAGRKGRKQPLQFEITNSGHDRTSICYTHHDYSERVLNGTVQNDQWFAYVCGLDDGDDPFTDPSCWIKANPNLGVSIEPSYIEQQITEAKGMASKEAIVRRLNLCQWTRTRTRAIDLALWDQCPDLRGVELAGLPCFGGLDLGMSDDWSAFAVVFELGDGQYGVECHFWLPEATTQREDGRPYEAWLDAGLIRVTPGSVTDYDVIESDVLDLCERYGVREVGFDKRFSMQLAHHLVGAGQAMIDQPQGFALSEACVRLQELIAAGRLHHDRNPILTWQVGNLVVRTGRYQEVRPDKQESAEKIDGVVASLMGLARSISQPEEIGSVYEERGIVTL